MFNTFDHYPWLKPLSAAVVVASTLAGWPAGLSAASITWGPAVTISGDADVATTGTLLYAVNDANLAATVNTVGFAAGNNYTSLGGNVTLSGFYWYSTSAFGSGAGSPWSSLSASYQSVLQGAAYAANNATGTVTLNNLSLGHTYQVQLWVNDTRSGASNRAETVTSPGGNTVTLDYNSTAANGGVGQFTVGTFTANATTQVFTLTGVQPAGGNSAQLNALQVRDQGAQINWSAPATVAGDADVATNGALIYGYDEANAGTTVNGVAFLAGNSATALGGNVTLSGFYAVDSSSFASGSGNSWNNLSSAYRTLLQGAAWGNTANAPATVTLNNLVAGHAYLVQVWVNDNRSAGAGRTETVGSNVGNSVTLAYNNLNAIGGVGQFTIGRFTAPAASVAFTLTGNASSQLNALQLRDLSIATNAGTISLAPATTYQQMYGLGGNFCQGDQITLINYGLTNQVFSPQGLNLSFIRLANTYSLTESQFANMAAYNNSVITRFRAMQPKGTIFMSAWSPPENLKSTGSAFQGTLAKTGGSYVYPAYANWWLASLQYYQSNSTLPDYVTIQNEPNWYPSGSTNAAYNAGCELDATEGSHAGYPQALAAVVSALQANGLGTVKIAAPDIEYIHGNIVSQYLAGIPSGTVSAIAHHLYGDNAATTGASLLAQFETQYPHTTWPKFMSEMNPGDDLGTNEPDYMGLAVTIHNVLTLENANTYSVWSIMWGLIYPPSGQPVSDNYYALGHFSKFIQPGDWRASATATDTNVLVSMYLRHVGPLVSDRLTLVLINAGGNYSAPVVNLATNWALDPLQRSWQVYQTANTGASERLTLIASQSGAGLTNNPVLLLPPYSITTAIINTGVYTNAAPAFTSTAPASTLNPGQTFTLTNTATDPNLPAQTLTYSLATAPPGAVVNPTNGILTWRPLISQAGNAYRFAVVVSDNGTPSLNATQSFRVTVRPVTLPVLSAPLWSNAQFFATLNGSNGPDYTLQASTNLVNWTTLFTTNPAVLPFAWVDATNASAPSRFYRVLLEP